MVMSHCYDRFLAILSSEKILTNPRPIYEAFTNQECLLRLVGQQVLMNCSRKTSADPLPLKKTKKALALNVIQRSRLCRTYDHSWIMDPKKT